MPHVNAYVATCYLLAGTVTFSRCDTEAAVKCSLKLLCCKVFTCATSSAACR